MPLNRFAIFFLAGALVGRGVCIAADPRDSDVSRHWAYQPIADPEPPVVSDSRWIRNGIDRFILHKLDLEKVSPSGEANRSTLIRRVYLDLIGLPPSREEWRRWMAESGAGWYEAMVDELLMSPHYGERWGRFWLDQARYADTDGYEKDSPRPEAYRWRDWVIDALNRDLPFDQFTEQQLAGDLLAGAGESTRIATGFHRNTLTNREGGIDKEEDRVKQVVDRVNTTATVWLGLTVQCAQCHDHKYDPISQAEYYQFYAFFNNSDERDYALAATRAEQDAFERAQAEHQREIEQARVELDKIRERILIELPEIEASLLEQHPNGVAAAATNGLLTHFTFDDREGGIARNSVTGQNEALFQGADKPETGRGVIGNALKLNGKDERLQVTSAIPFKTTNAFSLAAWVFQEGGIGGVVTKMDEDARFHGVDFTSNAGILEVHLVDRWPDDAIKVTTREAFKKGEWHHVLMTYDGSKKAAGVVLYVDGKLQEVKVHFDQLQGSFETDELVRIGSRRRSSFLAGLIDEVRIYDRVLSGEEAMVLGRDGPLLEVIGIAGIKSDDRTPAQQDALVDYALSGRETARELKKKLHELTSKPPRLQHGTAMGLVQRESPRRTFTHLRGDFLAPGEEVHAGTPAFLHELKRRGGEPDRLDLARWILDPDNPLTARVTVNRFWQQYFGRGIVESGEDFGSEGSPPSHPQLLDWLASRFVERDWSMKRLHRLIVCSATYRQSGAARPELAERDPYNRWLARQNRRRVEAETVRDLALAAGGLLDRRVKGPSVFPPLPAGIIELAFVDVIDRNPWRVSTGGDRYRRGLYTYFQRTSPYPMLTLFDAPDSNTACTRRESSNTPLQALTLWNDPVFMECCRALAGRVAREVPPGPDAARQRIDHAVALCLSREPEQEERADLMRLYRRSLAQFEADPRGVADLLGGVTLPDSTSPPELAAWTAVARALINLDEFITKE